MRLYVSLAAMALFGVLFLSACNSNDQSLAGPANPSPQAQPSKPPGVKASTTPTQPPLNAQQFPTPATVPSPSGEEPRRITPAELKPKLASGQAILIDVRGEAAYSQGHIKGSLQIPYAEVVNHAGEFSRSKLIVTYCS
jgi:hypothetical protein